MQDADQSDNQPAWTVRDGFRRQLRVPDRAAGRLPGARGWSSRRHAAGQRAPQLATRAHARRGQRTELQERSSRTCSIGTPTSSTPTPSSACVSRSWSTCPPEVRSSTISCSNVLIVHVPRRLTGPESRKVVMSKVAPPFRADHVGSLLRPPEIHAARAKRARGEIDDAELRGIEERGDRRHDPRTSKQPGSGASPTASSGVSGSTWTSSSSSTASPCRALIESSSDSQETVHMTRLRRSPSPASSAMPEPSRSTTSSSWPSTPT